ncbi:MAG: two-component regulator propeller domain-containing protein [Bacteroidales bacterium]|jgi:signal transduction histidine kinase/DNA-binding response OmpR family regulator/ligand-binding sensor domain-containing protein
MKKTLFCLGIVILWIPLFAEDYVIQRLTNNDGLSNSSINIIFQDSKQIMWFGTWDGLNMYNGSDFKVYKPVPGNPKSISNNIIRDIIQVSEDVLWIATDVGINSFSVKDRAFKRFFVDTLQAGITNEHSYHIAFDRSSGRLFAWVYQQGLYGYNPEQKQFYRLNIAVDLNIKKMVFDDQNCLWILTKEKELHKHSFNGKADVPGIEEIRQFSLLSDIESVFYAHYYGLIIQTVDGRLYLYDTGLGMLSDTAFEIPEKGTVRDFCYRDSIFYLATDKGLYSYDLRNGTTLEMIGNCSVLSVHCGTQNILWVGTDMQGIFKIVPSQERFITYSSQNVTDFGNSAVRTFCEDREGNLFVGTKGSGIYAFNRDEKSSRLVLNAHYRTEQGLTSNSVFTITRGENNTFWIGTDGNGINYYDSNSEQIRKLTPSNNLKDKINLSSVYALLPEDDNLLWAGTSGYGMYRLEIDNAQHPYRIKNFRQYVFCANQPSLSNNIVYSIIRDDPSHLWIATRGGGINRFNTVDETFETFKFSQNNPDYSSSDDVLCLYEDHTGNLWAGTSMGLNKISRGPDGILHVDNFSEKNGMPNNTIHGILEDKQNNIWVSTNNGIAKLSREKEPYKIISYYASDGLQNNEFSDGAYYASPNTSLFYFGGISGFNEFNPLTIIHDDSIPMLLLDAFYVDNEEYNLSDFLVQKKDQDVLTLSYKYKSFGFHFSHIDYLTGPKCEISYKLEGYQSDWVQLRTSNTIVFTNLPKGKYVLNVKNSNADKVWGETCFTLPIMVNPPWWESNLAYFFYALLGFFLLLGVRKMMFYKIKVRNDIRLKEMEKQKAEEIHQAKLSFFTNIAHEFSNSLTLIYSPCEKLLKEKSSGMMTKKYVQIIKSNSERMQHLIQQLIEFRKADTGHLKLNIEIIDIQELIKFVLDNFIDIMEQKKIRYSITSIPGNIHWQTDRDSVEKIVFNLLSNAVKYTPENEKIDIITDVRDNMLSIRVTNTGIGIKPAFQEYIFDRFEVLNRFEEQVSYSRQSRHGIGLALCKSITRVLQGDINVQSDGQTYTSFIVHLPEAPLIPQPDLIVDEQPEGGTHLAHRVMAGLLEDHDTIPPNEGGISERKATLILIVEDDLQIRSMIREFLSDRYNILEASNGKEAIEITEQYLPQLIISDIIMPVMNGVAFVKEIRSRDHTKHIPVIFLSAKSDIESQIEGYAIGADAYLNKPFNIRHLEVLIASLLNKTKTLSEYSNSPSFALEQFEGRIMHKEDKELLLRITQTVYDNIDNETLSMDFIAKEIAISKMQLYRKIKEVTGMTPTEYIRSIRLNHAEKLLKTTNKTVQEIMYQSGFNNKAYFYKEFSKKYHLTPKEYRNQFV